MRCVSYLLLFQSTTWPCLFGDLSTPIAFALLDAAIVMSDGYHHVATTLSQITGKLQWSVHISAYHSMSRSMRMMVDKLIALTTSGWRDRRREHTSSFDDGHHHVADGVEPISKGNTVFCSDRYASFVAPLISDECSRAYRYHMTAGVIGIGNKEQHGVCSFCVMWCRRACVRGGEFCWSFEWGLAGS